MPIDFPFWFERQTGFAPHAWRRRFVWYLRMRTLVEQTADVARAWLKALERGASPPQARGESARD